MEKISSQFSKESGSEELLFQNVNVNILLFMMFIKKTFDERTDDEEYTPRQHQTKNSTQSTTATASEPKKSTISTTDMFPIWSTSGDYLSLCLSNNKHRTEIT